MIRENKSFKLDNFEGPLDLLLQMIRSKELDLLDVSLVEVADQYIDFVYNSKDIDLNEASEYLLIASQLVEMKSKHMLKSDIFQEKKPFEDDDSENLLIRLIEYERYKKASQAIEELYTKAPRFEKVSDDFAGFVNSDEEKVMELVPPNSEDLIKAMRNMLIRLKNQEPAKAKLRFKRISVEQRKEEIDTILSSSQETTLMRLVEKQPTNHFIAITLLVVLEMAKAGVITVEQNKTYDDIVIRKVVNND